MELSCILSLFLLLRPYEVPSEVMQVSFKGNCNMAVAETTVRIERHGILHIENDYKEYLIPLPTNKDKIWLQYKLGDHLAYLGNCHYSAHPFDDDFCKTIMVQIGLIGWH
jgi:hypothetical protein